MYFSWLAALLFVLSMPLQVKSGNACEHAAPPAGMKWVCAKGNGCDCRLEAQEYQISSGEQTLKSNTPGEGNSCLACRISFFVVPAYPEAARKAAKQGAVSATVVVTAEGQVEQVLIRSGDPPLTSAVDSALRHWRFTPGERTESIPVSVKFVFSDDASKAASGTSLLNLTVTAQAARIVPARP